MNVKAINNLFINIGQKNQKTSFNKVELYKYDFMNSGFNKKVVINNFGTYSIFNEFDFLKHFELI